jgi:hypothetical protein
MEHAGQEFACDAVQDGDHEQEALRRGEGGGKGTCLQGSVHGGDSAGFGLHLHEGNRLPNMFKPPLAAHTSGFFGILEEGVMG